MSMIFKTLESKHIDLEALPDYEGIACRFQEGFSSFVRRKKLEAVVTALQEEFGPAIVLEKPRLVQDVLDRLDDATLMEKPYIFVSVNPKILI